MPVATAGSKTLFSHFNPLSRGEGYRTGCFPRCPWSMESLGAISLYARGRRDRTGLFPPSACGGENRAGLFPSMPVVDGIVRGFFPLCLWLRELLGAVSLYAVVDGIARGYFPLSLWERAGVRASDPTTRRRSPSDGVPPKFNNL